MLTPMAGGSSSSSTRSYSDPLIYSTILLSSSSLSFSFARADSLLLLLCSYIFSLPRYCFSSFILFFYYFNPSSLSPHPPLISLPFLMSTLLGPPLISVPTVLPIAFVSSLSLSLSLSASSLHPLFSSFLMIRSALPFFLKLPCILLLTLLSHRSPPVICLTFLSYYFFYLPSSFLFSSPI